MKILATVVEDCACPKCGHPASMCITEILGLSVLAGVYLLLVTLILLAIASSTGTYSPVTGDLQTGN